LPGDFPSDARDSTLAAAAATSVNQDDADGADRFLLALDDRPVTAGVATIRGRAALSRSNLQTALHAFDAALAIDPDSIEAAWGRAETDRRYGNNDKAREAFERILARDPGNLRALESLAKLDVDFSRWPEAEAIQRRALAVDPRANAAARAQLAEILLREDKLNEAYQAMMDCLAQDPYNYQTHVNLGEMLAEQNRWADARPHLEFVMRFFPDQTEKIYPLLFQADKALSDPSAAAKAVRFGLRMFPDDSELHRLNMLL
jgi:tetratricopeptide (TPR) repeat protein